MERRAVSFLMVATLAGAAVLTAANLWFGELNQDEGWYLYAARLVAEGKWPFLDFASTQGPVMPCVYALAEPLVRIWGVAGGRGFTALLGWVGMLLAARLAARLAPPASGRAAVLLSLMLTGLNVYQSYFSTIVKTYALAGLILVAAFLVLNAAWERRSAGLAAGAGILFVLAAGARASAAAAFLGALAMLLAAFARETVRVRDAVENQGAVKRCWLPGAMLIGGCVAGMLVFGPFWLKAREALWFALIEYHAGRRAGSVLQTLAYKAGFLARVTQAYLAAVLVFGLAALYAALHRNTKGSRPAWLPPVNQAGLPLMVLWGAVAAVTGVHLLAPFPYDDYQAMIFPLAAVATVAWLLRVLGCIEAAFGRNGAGVRLWVLFAVFFVSVATVVASPMVQEWFVGPRDRIWWPLKKETPLRVLQRTAAALRDELGLRSGELLLTQDLYLAVEARACVPRGMELGPFSYFPEWSTEKAVQCHVLNRAMLTALLENCPARIAAFSGYGLAIRAPEIQPLSAREQAELWSIVRRNYELWAVVEPFGQAATRLEILRRRELK